MNASAININATTVRYDQLSELADLLINYTGKREEIETLLNSNDPFAERTNQIAGISVSGEAVQIGLQAELTAMELKLQNRFNILVGRPLPKVTAAPVEEVEDVNGYAAESRGD